jgi:hypothetical protein
VVLKKGKIRESFDIKTAYLESATFENLFIVKTRYKRNTNRGYIKDNIRNYR